LLTPADNPHKRAFVLQRVRDSISAENARLSLALYQSAISSGNAVEGLSARAGVLIDRLYDLAYGHWEPKVVETPSEKIARQFAALKKSGFTTRLAEAIRKRQLELFPSKAELIDKSYRKNIEEPVK
jgi:hypothetical protein